MSREAGMSNASATSGKRAKNAKYWGKYKKVMNEVETVSRPQDQKCNKEFLRDQRGRNMDLFQRIKTPYEAVLDWIPSQKLFKSKNPKKAAIYPKKVKLQFVDTEEAVNNMIRSLSTCTEFAMDVEFNNHNSYLGMTCLLQISTWKEDFIVDPFPIHEKLKQALAPILADGDVLKILFGASSMDVPCLRRDFGFVFVGAIDVQECIKMLTGNKEPMGFKTAVEKYKLGWEVDKTVQNFDWRVRPLLEKMINYARDDSHLLLRLWNIIRIKMIEMGGNGMLLNAFTRTSQTVLLKECKRPKPKTASQALTDHCVHLQGKQFDVFNSLFTWRERQSKAIDCQPYELISVGQMVTLSKSNAKSEDDIVEVLGTFDKLEKRKRLGVMLEKQGRALLRILEEGSSYIRKLENTVCYNCFYSGHVAFYCPFPSNGDRVKVYLNDRPIAKKARNKKNWEKWLARKGIVDRVKNKEKIKKHACQRAFQR